MPAANDLGVDLDHDLALCETLLRRVCVDLGMLLARPLVLENVQVARSSTKAAGERSVHIAFKFAVCIDGVYQHGALLAPLPDAIALASYLMMSPDESVAALRKGQELERAQKDALVEVGALVSHTLGEVLRERWPGRVSARSEGCQGLRAGAAPAFERTPGVDLLIGRAKAKLHTFPSFELLLMLPALPPAAPSAAA